MARPSIYSQELADKICAELASGSSMRTVSKNDWCPSLETMFRWIREKPEFREQYARAKEESADFMADEVLDIADESVNDWMEVHYGSDEESVAWKVNNEAVQRSKLRVDTRKWLMSKMKPKKYGDKIDMTTNGKDLPTPLLHAIRNNDSDQKDSSAH